MNCNKPDIVPLVSWGQYAEYEERLYSLYIELYCGNRLFADGLHVKPKYYPPEYNQKSSFYHRICENYDHTKDENDRKPNRDRCEKIGWGKHIIDSYETKNCIHIMIWENERLGKKNLLLYCPELDYLVVLSRRRDYYLLTTAYPIDRDHTRIKLLKEYESYKANNASN